MWGQMDYTNNDWLKRDEARIADLQRLGTKAAWVASVLILMSIPEAPRLASRKLETFQELCRLTFRPDSGERTGLKTPVNPNDRMLISRARKLAGIESSRDHETGQTMWIRYQRESQQQD